MSKFSISVPHLRFSLLFVIYWLLWHFKKTLKTKISYFHRGYWMLLGHEVGGVGGGENYPAHPQFRPFFGPSSRYFCLNNVAKAREIRTACWESSAWRLLQTARNPCISLQCFWRVSSLAHFFSLFSYKNCVKATYAAYTSWVFHERIYLFLAQVIYVWIMEVVQCPLDEIQENDGNCRELKNKRSRL